MACVYIAGKVEECPRRARDVVNAFYHLYCKVRNMPLKPMPYVCDIYYIWRDRLITAESIVLRDLGFRVQPELPVGLLISYLKILIEVKEEEEVVVEDEKEEADFSRENEEAATGKAKSKKPVSFSQVALNFLNDALSSPVTT
jgi:hypothetical protein